MNDFNLILYIICVPFFKLNQLNNKFMDKIIVFRRENASISERNRTARQGQIRADSTAQMHGERWNRYRVFREISPNGKVGLARIAPRSCGESGDCLLRILGDFSERQGRVRAHGAS